MEGSIYQYIYWTVNSLFFIYGMSLLTIYFGGIILSDIAVKRNKRKSQFLLTKDIVSATDIPSVTLVAPAFNEGVTIVDNVKSLLSIQYPFYDLILVNDGSTDNSMELLIKEFELEPFDSTFITQPIPTATVNKIYRSNKIQYKQLTVIDKNNGGRSDAINAGINFAQSELILCTDADCIIEQDALLKMVRPYLEEGEKEIIACGGSIGIANDSLIQDGILKELRLPRNLVPMIQVVEYIRAFLIGRMGWGEINGLMLVSGAFGMYPRTRLLEVGGFNHATVGEDLELCIRLRVHMERLKKPYKVVYIPETLCWTEAPPDYNILVKQRDRWARGLWETLSIHKYLFINPRYRNMGIFFFPYWCFFEFGAPIVEFLGLVSIIVFGLLGWINWNTAILLFTAVYLLGCIFSTIAIYLYVRNFRHYATPKQVIELLLAAYLEPFLYHPVLLFGQMKGYYKKLFKIKSGWGSMTRKGFTTTNS
ncbi:glycosyltransferase family 2 protein [Antarcticibacterium flavum]|uniref:Glycosyltransferase family 2 protein n=1 Tax=Antarcticibacterium flavum TaxID=2058175 RepID=A0A5B7X693_9FLAO|nr:MULTISPECIES: glycosyltransferase [Antarcticibacterium]MCM4159264.1 glycosyltransferase family 2 protein [Antarcticibacterium sp. W02-3]QCY71024.1 glycosyltransferase family 2 protein [Antarcticibacterium flavum]